MDTLIACILFVFIHRGKWEENLWCYGSFTLHFDPFLFVIFCVCMVICPTLCICLHTGPPSGSLPSLISNAQPGHQAFSEPGQSLLWSSYCLSVGPIHYCRSSGVFFVLWGFFFVCLFWIISCPSPSQLVSFASSKANPVPAFIRWQGLGRDMGFLINPRQASRLLPIRLRLLPSWSQSLSFFLLFATSSHSSTALISWAVETPWTLEACCSTVSHSSLRMAAWAGWAVPHHSVPPLSSLLALSL